MFPKLLPEVSRVMLVDCKGHFKMHNFFCTKPVLEDLGSVFWVILLENPAMRHFVSGTGEHEHFEDFLNCIFSIMPSVKCKDHTISSKDSSHHNVAFTIFNCEYMVFGVQSIVDWMLYVLPAVRSKYVEL
jgi:hypothetical protein